jgi:hypothetical protein
MQRLHCQQEEHRGDRVALPDPYTVQHFVPRLSIE